MEKRRPIDKNTRDAVWIKYMGNKVEGKCYCCKIRTIHITDFQVGHNKAVANGGTDNILNLRPICGLVTEEWDVRCRLKNIVKNILGVNQM